MPSVVMWNVVMPNVIMLNVIMPNVIMQNVIMPNVIMPNVIMPNVIMPNVIMPNDIMPNVIMLNVVMPNVMAPRMKTESIKRNLLLPLYKSCGLNYKSCMIVIYDRNQSTIVTPVLQNYNPSLTIVITVHNPS